MATVGTEKTSVQDIPRLRNPNSHNHTTETQHRFRKAIAILASTFVILWLLPAPWERLGALNVMGGGGSNRERRIDTGSQALDGQFDLLDLLSIRSTSGEIRAGIRPLPADKQSPLPAQVSLSSHSGKISADFSAFNAPERDYRVSIESRSGVIDGEIIHGRWTSVTTASAAIEMQITPYAADDYASTLHVSTASGRQQISLSNPAKDPGTAIKRMSSSHRTKSGALVLQYPREWEGTIEGRTKSGKLELHGGDLDIIHRDSTNGHYVLAKKGNGNSTLSFDTLSGSVDIYFN